MELLALKGILADFDFSGVGGHPIGIASISSFLKLCGADPLVVFYYLQPFLSAVCFTLLFKMLITVLPDKFAFFIALSSMSSLILIKAMNQVTAEIISLTTILFLMTFVWKIIVLKMKIDLTSIAGLVILSWVAIFFRNASLFIILGILLFLYLRNNFGRIRFFMISLIILAPGIVIAIFWDNPGYLKNIFSLDAPYSLITQFVKHIMNFTEIIIPYSLHLNAIPWLKLLIGMACLFICLMMYKKKDLTEPNDNRILLGNCFFTIGISYYCILSLAAIYYEYPWGNVYRVSGFGIFFILNAFWIYIFCFPNARKKFILVILVLSSLTKLSYGLRYEILSHKHRLLHYDYRHTAETVKNFIKYKGNKDKLLIYTVGNWEGKNLYYILRYYDLIYSLPFQVERYVESQEDDTILLCAFSDLHIFNQTDIDYESINNLEGFYSIKL